MFNVFCILLLKNPIIILFISIYTFIQTIKSVSEYFSETQGLTSNKQKWQEKRSFN